jgi:hypothetical protein
VSKTPIVDQVKIWITPIVISILGMMLWRDINEVRSDVKSLLAATSVNSVHIENLKTDVEALKVKVFYNAVTRVSAPQTELVAIKPEEYEIKPKKEKPNLKRI